MKKLLITVLAIGIVVAGVGLYFYYKPVTHLVHVSPDYTAYTSDELETLFTQILQNPDRYIGKVIEFRGAVSEINIKPSGGGYLLMKVDRPEAIINVQLDHRVYASTVQSGEECKIRAEFTGIEEDLIDPEVYIVYFKQATILNR
ncbi:MAG: hypothetical protein ACK4KT_03395 [Thermaurantimonas sp.]